GTLYFATGNAGTCSQSETYAVSLIEVNLSDLSLIGSWQVPQNQQVSDSDFGSTPTLFQATINGVVQSLVGLENKNGIYYTFVRGSLNNGPLWQATIAVGEIYSPSAWNGKTLFVGGGWANISGTSCQGASHTGSLRAVDPATGNFLWQDCFITGQVQGAVTVVPGVIAVGAGTALKLVASTSGKILFTYFLTSGVFFGATSISNGVLYIGDSKGNLYAFAP
ncbi:MAG TPA: PQQ-binding-like beta-propeller repeat protein, partial [Ktedonobacteraceae bacterium]|nr:PQQ-binding-like beta-propeller repeat protein [Ktedonobacteraceae bacterium]